MSVHGVPGPPRILGPPRFLGHHRILGLHRVLDPHRVLVYYKVLGSGSRFSGMPVRSSSTELFMDEFIYRVNWHFTKITINNVRYECYQDNTLNNKPFIEITVFLRKSKHG